VEYRKLLDDSLFEVASHTYSHKLPRDYPLCGPAASKEQKQREIFQGKALLENVFERPCLGFRPGCGFDDGLKGTPEILDFVNEAGFQYVSSILRGADYSLPAPLSQPFSYAIDGFSDLWELPDHGWHENLLKDNNNLGALRMTLWPPEMPQAIPLSFISTPEEEFAINRVFV